MKRLFCVITIATFLAANIAAAYDLSHSKLQGKSHAPMTVALVPFAESYSPSLKNILQTMRSELLKTRGIRVMDESSMQEILRYYQKYVHRTAEDDPVQTTLADARQALLEGRYDQSEALLRRVQDKISAKVKAGGTNEGLYQCHLLMAKIHYANHSSESVAQDYDRLIALHPDIEMDANLYSSWERGALKQAKERLEKTPRGSIKVRTIPAGSEVFVNGIHRGMSPMTVKDLPSGLHVIEIKTVNHAPLTRQVSLAAGENADLNLKLVRTDVASGSEASTTIRPSLYRSDVEVSKLISTLGYHMGVDRIVLVADRKERGMEAVLYRVGDTGLGSVRQFHQVDLSSVAGGKTNVSGVIGALNDEIRADILKNPPKYARQNVGSVKLHQHRRPFYKKPLFWVLTAAAAGTGGILGAVVGGAAATGGVLVAF